MKQILCTFIIHSSWNEKDHKQARQELELVAFQNIRDHRISSFSFLRFYSPRHSEKLVKSLFKRQMELLTHSFLLFQVFVKNLYILSHSYSHLSLHSVQHYHNSKYRFYYIHYHCIYYHFWCHYYRNHYLCIIVVFSSMLLLLLSLWLSLSIVLLASISRYSCYHCIVISNCYRYYHINNYYYINYSNDNSV